MSWQVLAQNFACGVLPVAVPTCSLAFLSFFLYFFISFLFFSSCLFLSSCNLPIFALLIFFVLIIFFMSSIAIDERRIRFLSQFPACVAAVNTLLEQLSNNAQAATLTDSERTEQNCLISDFLAANGDLDERMHIWNGLKNSQFANNQIMGFVFSAAISQVQKLKMPTSYENQRLLFLLSIFEESTQKGAAACE